MIDIHSHILFGVDDGAQDVIDSTEMIRIAGENGVTDIIATPHCYPGVYNNYNGRTLESRFSEFENKIAQTDSVVHLHRGMEVFLNDDIFKIFDDGRLLTLANSHYLLVECDFNENVEFVNYAIHSFRKRGIHPIIAHPERYHFLKGNIEIAFRWVEMGASLQVNAGSITGYFGAESMNTAFNLINEGAVQFVASDSHGAIKRTPELYVAFEKIGAQFSFDTAVTLFENNPKRVIDDASLIFPKVRSMGYPDDFFISDEEFWDK